MIVLFEVWYCGSESLDLTEKYVQVDNNQELKTASIYSFDSVHATLWSREHWFLILSIIRKEEVPEDEK